MSNNEPTLEEIKNIIDDISDRIEEACERGFGLSLRSIFGKVSVDLCGVTLWSDEEDPRDYILDEEGEETEEREDLQGYLECKISDIASLLLRADRPTR